MNTVDSTTLGRRILELLGLKEGTVELSLLRSGQVLISKEGSG